MAARRIEQAQQRIALPILDRFIDRWRKIL